MSELWPVGLLFLFLHEILCCGYRREKCSQEYPHVFMGKCEVQKDVLLMSTYNICFQEENKEYVCLHALFIWGYG